MSNTMLGYLLFCAGLRLMFAGSLDGHPVKKDERLETGAGLALILAGMGFFASGVLS